jgi:hypothetical protein
MRILKRLPLYIVLKLNSIKVGQRKYAVIQSCLPTKTPLWAKLKDSNSIAVAFETSFQPSKVLPQFRLGPSYPNVVYGSNQTGLSRAAPPYLQICNNLQMCPVKFLVIAHTLTRLNTRSTFRNTAIGLKHTFRSKERLGCLRSPATCPICACCPVSKFAVLLLQHSSTCSPIFSKSLGFSHPFARL